MKVRLDRNSVSMGDDVFSHEKEIEVEGTITFYELFQNMKNIRYLPSISGNDVAWSLFHEGDELLVYFTKYGETKLLMPLKTVEELCISSNFFFLKYYTTPANFEESLVNATYYEL